MKTNVLLILLGMSLQTFAQAVPDYSTSAFGLSKDVTKMEETVYTHQVSDDNYATEEKTYMLFENGLQKEYRHEYLSIFESTTFTKYTYNSSGKIIKEETTTTSTYGNTKNTIEYVYQNNKLVKLIYTDPDSDPSSSYGSYTVTYDYDSKGKLLKSTKTFSNGSLDTVTEYYDVKDEKNYSKKDTYYSSEGIVYSTNTETYVNGLYSSGSYSSDDYGDSNYQYSYDSKGNIVKTFESGDVSEDNTYEYDSKGNWYKCKSYQDDWLFGEVEKYKFRKITYKTGSIGNTDLDMSFVNKYPPTLKNTTNTSTDTTTSSTTHSSSNPGCEGNCTDGYGTYYYNDGGIYDGFFKNGYRNGPGIYSFTDGSYYSGNWVDGRKEGFAMYSWKDGSMFFGYYKNEKLNGQGVYINEDKVIKGGIFKDGNFDTTYEINDNGTSSGCASGDCENGFGKYVYSNGDIYVGFFSNGYFTNGAYSYGATKDIYIGEFLYNKKNGFGIYTWANKNSYIGMYQNDTYHGYGYYYDDSNADNDLIGEFRNGSLYKNMIEK